MNPQPTTHNSQPTTHNPQPSITIASIATFADRIGIIEDAVASLVDQVDLIFIYANDLPSYLNARKILNGNVKKLQGPNITDRGKFQILNELKNTDYYFFACDDDLIYPPDYISKSIEFLQYYNNQAIMSYHGKKLVNKHITSYYKDKNNENNRINYRCLGEVKQQYTVDIIGTGVMCFHIPYFCPLNLKQDMMADIEVSIHAKKQNKTMMVIPHPEGWIRYNPKMRNKWTIWDSFQKQPDTIQTQLINENFK